MGEAINHFFESQMAYVVYDNGYTTILGRDVVAFIIGFLVCIILWGAFDGRKVGKLKIDKKKIKAMSIPELKNELICFMDPFYMEYAEAVMKELKLKEAEKITKTIETVCDKFCKYNGTGKDNQCVYSLTHAGKCPFDEIMKELEQ